MYQNVDVNACPAKSPTECCAWITLFISTVAAWDIAPEYNFAIAIFGLVAVRSSDTRLVSYMALLVPLLLIADLIFLLLPRGGISHLDPLNWFSTSILIILLVIKGGWSYFASKLMSEMNGTYLAFLDCCRGTLNWFKGLPSGSELPPPEPMQTLNDSYQKRWNNADTRKHGDVQLEKLLDSCKFHLISLVMGTYVIFDQRICHII